MTFNCSVSFCDLTQCLHRKAANLESMVSIHSVTFFEPVVKPVVDPGFPRGHQPPKGAPTYHLAIFPENCVKMKKGTSFSLLTNTTENMTFTRATYVGNMII